MAGDNPDAPRHVFRRLGGWVGGALLAFIVLIVVMVAILI